MANRLFILAVVLAVSLTSTLAQDLPVGATRVDAAQQRELLNRIEGLESNVVPYKVSRKPGSQLLTVDKTGTTMLPLGIQPINPGLANIEVVTTPNNEVIARVNLANLPPNSFMVTFKGNGFGQRDFQQGIFFSDSGCQSCAFDIEPGDKTSFLDWPSVIEYGAYFFINGNTFLVIGQKGINGAVAHRFLKGNPHERDRKLHIEGEGFAAPVVVSLRSVNGGSFVVSEAPDVTVKPNLVVVDLDSPSLQWLQPGDYTLAVANGVSSNATCVYLSLESSAAPTRSLNSSRKGTGNVAVPPFAPVIINRPAEEKLPKRTNKINNPIDQN